MKIQFKCKVCSTVSETTEELRQQPCLACQESGKSWAALEEMICRPGQNYILDEQGEPKPARTLAEWAAFMEMGAEKEMGGIVKQQWVDNVRVSTIFLGLNHNWGEGPPILWETMTFSNRANWDQSMDRCSGGREQAEAMHQRMVEAGRAAVAAPKK